MAGDAHVETQPAAAKPPPFSPQCNNDISKTCSEPLRLSEISPHKLQPKAIRPSSPANTGILQDGRDHAISPMRPTKKRVSTDEDPPQEYRRRKRGKMMAADADFERGSSKVAVSQDQPHAKKATRVHEEQPVTYPETCDSTQHPESSKSTLPSPRTKYKPKLTSSRCKGPTLDAFPYLSSSRQVHERVNKGQSEGVRVRSQSSMSGISSSSRLRQARTIRQENAIESSHTHQRSGLASTADLPLIEKKQVRKLY